MATPAKAKPHGKSDAIKADTSPETAAADVLVAHGFRRAKAVDFVGPDGRVIANLKRSVRSGRDLRDAALQMASWAREPTYQRAILIVLEHPFSDRRLVSEWHQLRELLHPDISAKLELIALGTRPTTVPDASELRSLAAQLEGRQSQAESTARRHPATTFEILKLLLVRWLRHEPPARIKELQTLSGFSYPTVAKSIVELGDIVSRGTDRSVQLLSFPRRQWNEWTAMAYKARRSAYFVDRSGAASSDIQDLLRRLARAKPKSLAVGGVLAARHWHPRIDLQGVPRLDLEIHVPEGKLDLSFIARLDPALEQTHVRTKAAVLAVHAVHRSRPLFDPSSEGGLPFADPVETLLDLRDLRLMPQETDLVNWMRKH
jgi:hypothetical protein